MFIMSLFGCVAMFWLWWSGRKRLAEAMDGGTGMAEVDEVED